MLGKHRRRDQRSLAPTTSARRAVSTATSSNASLGRGSTRFGSPDPPPPPSAPSHLGPHCTNQAAAPPSHETPWGGRRGRQRFSGAPPAPPHPETVAVARLSELLHQLLEVHAAGGVGHAMDLDRDAGRRHPGERPWRSPPRPAAASESRHPTNPSADLQPLEPERAETFKRRICRQALCNSVARCGAPCQGNTTGFENTHLGLLNDTHTHTHLDAACWGCVMGVNFVDNLHEYHERGSDKNTAQSQKGGVAQISGVLLRPKKARTSANIWRDTRESANPSPLPRKAPMGPWHRCPP